jgi:hypothetical protein
MRGVLNAHEWNEHVLISSKTLTELLRFFRSTGKLHPICCTPATQRNATQYDATQGTATLNYQRDPGLVLCAGDPTSGLANRDPGHGTRPGESLSNGQIWPGKTPSSA